MRHWYCPVVFPEKMKMKHGRPSGIDGGGGASTDNNTPADDAAASDDALRGMYRHRWRRGDVGKGAEEWTSEEEAELHRLRVEENLSWEETASRLGTGRTPKQCRERHQPPWWGGGEPNSLDP